MACRPFCNTLNVVKYVDDTNIWELCSANLHDSQIQLLPVRRLSGQAELDIHQCRQDKGNDYLLQSRGLPGILRLSGWERH